MVATSEKSRRPKVEKSGAWTMPAGSWAAPGVVKPFPPAKARLRTMAITVVATIPRRSAPARGEP